MDDIDDLSEEEMRWLKRECEQNGILPDGSRLRTHTDRKER